MSETTAIQWTDSTWNIVTGCTRVGPGCARCYIERTPPFRMTGRKFETVAGASTTGVTLHWDRLQRVPRGPKVFTPSLGDLFHEDVPEQFVAAAAFLAFQRNPDRIFQVLTKRPERARELLGDWKPLPNVWMGVSIENARYTWRADVLREIPAAVRFISAEPLLGSLFDVKATRGGEDGAVPAKDRPRREPLDLAGIDWVIVGGESGPGARPFHLEHAREIERATSTWTPVMGFVDGVAPWEALHVPALFVKQLGAKPRYLDDLTIGVYKDKPLPLRDRKGGDWDEWPADLRIREFPRTAVHA